MALDTAVSLSSGSAVALTSFGVVDIPGTGAAGGPQIARVFATVTTSGVPSGTATIRFLLVDLTATSTARCVGMIDATLTTTSVRTGSDGASGDYLCTIAMPDTTDRFDLLGASRDSRYRWYAGCSSALPTNVTAIRLDFSFTNVT